MSEQDHKDFMRPSQAEAGYVPLSATPSQACANCRWLVGDDYCHLISNMPESVVVTGWCNRWEAKPPAPTPEPIPVVIVEAPEMDMGEMSLKDAPPAEPEALPERKSLLEPVTSWIKENLMPLLHSEEKTSAGFKAIPDRNVWLAWWTTTTKDLEGELFAPQAIDDFIERVDTGLTPYPELWFGHMPIRHGQAKWLGRIGQIAVAAGTFDDTPLAQKFLAWYRKQTKELPVSHGYKYIKALKRNGVYYHFDTFEISTLHPTYMKAANPTAKFSEVLKMEITPEKMQSLTDVLGSDELAKQVAQEALSVLDKKNKELGEGESIGTKTDAEAPVIPVIDADARKDLDALKAAQTSLEATLTAAVTKAVQDAMAIEAKAMADELTRRDATIKTLTDKIDALETARKEEQELYAPASQSLITQLLSGGKANEDALELRKKNAETAHSKSVVDRFLGGQGIS